MLGCASVHEESQHSRSAENAPYRADGRCGAQWPLPSGAVSECAPDSAAGGPCCSESGWCGSTAEHCECKGCVDYSPKDDGGEENSSFCTCQPFLVASSACPRSCVASVVCVLTYVHVSSTKILHPTTTCTGVRSGLLCVAQTTIGGCVRSMGGVWGVTRSQGGELSAHPPSDHLGRQRRGRSPRRRQRHVRLAALWRESYFDELVPWAFKGGTVWRRLWPASV